MRARTRIVPSAFSGLSVLCGFCALLLAGCFHLGQGVKSCRYHFQSLDFAGMDALERYDLARLLAPAAREVE